MEAVDDVVIPNEADLSAMTDSKDELWRSMCLVWEDVEAEGKGRRDARFTYSRKVEPNRQ